MISSPTYHLTPSTSLHRTDPTFAHSVTYLDFKVIPIRRANYPHPVTTSLKGEENPTFAHSLCLTLPTPRRANYQNKLANLKMYQPRTCITLCHKHVHRVYRRTILLLQPCKLSAKCLGRLTTPTSKGGLCCYS